MRLALALVLLLLVAPLAHAEDTDRPNPNQPEVQLVQPSAGEMVAPAADLKLDPVQMQQQRSSEASDAVQEMPQRGSFWWIVGAIVVAGIILALVLD